MTTGLRITPRLERASLYRRLKTDHDSLERITACCDVLCSKAIGLVDSINYYRQIAIADASVSVPERFNTASHLIVGLVSCGEALESRVRTFFETGDLLAGYLLNEIGNELLFNQAVDLQAHLCARHDTSLGGISAAYCPGDGEMDVSLQTPLFELLRLGDDRRVRINEHHMLIPEKSMLFVMFIGSNITCEPGEHACARCNNTSCQQRQSF